MRSADTTAPDRLSGRPEVPLDHKTAFLQSHGAATAGHGITSLIAHLQGVSNLLRQYGARPGLCDAGLFHSVYGTESYTRQTIPDHLRPEVAALIGVEAERIARLFGVMEKESFSVVIA